MDSVPADIWYNVCTRLNMRDAESMSLVCKDIRRMALYRAKALQRLKIIFKTWEFDTMIKGRWPRITVVREVNTDSFVDKFTGKGIRTIIAYDGLIFIRTRSLLSKTTRSRVPSHYGQ